MKQALHAQYQFPLANLTGLNYLEFRAQLKPKPKKTDDALTPMVLIMALIDELHLTLGGAAGGITEIP